MKVILQKDVKDLGKIGDVVQVKSGHARNFLFPRNLAKEATESRVKEWEHLQKVVTAKMKKAKVERQGVLDKIGGQELRFKVQAGENDKLFGSISHLDIAKKLSGLGFDVDRKDIIIDDPIKALGEYKVFIQYEEGQRAEISLVIEKA